jgi:hypothetical protein
MQTFQTETATITERDRIAALSYTAIYSHFIYTRAIQLADHMTLVSDDKIPK